MSDLNMTVDVENIKKMDTFPNRDGMMSAEEVKAQFDKAPADIKRHINEVLVPAIDDAKGKAYAAVRFTEQALKKEEQEQARANIGASPNTAVLYEVQLLSEDQKAMARENINAADASAVVTSIDGKMPSAGNVSLSAVSYSEQALSSEEKETARNNIGAVSANEHAALKETAQATAQELGRVAAVVEDVVLTTGQALTDAQKSQARENIGAAPSGYGWGETKAASMPNDDADEARTTGLYRASSGTMNVPDNCELVFVQAANGGVIYQTAYCQNGTLKVRRDDHDSWSEWEQIGESEKTYEHIATITVAPDADGSLPQHVIFSADSESNPFELTDFIVQARAGFVDGSKSGLYMAVNNNKLVIGNSAVSGISATPRSFTIFYRQENDGSVRAEHTVSGSSTSFYNPANAINESRVVAPEVMTGFAGKTVTKIDLYTLTGDTKAWVEGSTFELWGVRA